MSEGSKEAQGAGVSTGALLEFCMAELDWQLGILRRLTELESPSGSPGDLARCAEALAGEAAGLGARTTGLDGGAALHVRAEFGTGRPRVVLLGHLDTVWPVGALPIQVRDGALHGPGVYDMKAGLAIGLQAVRALLAHDALPGTVVFLCTSDEEVGSTHSRALIEAEARHADAVLVLEPALANGAVKTGRKGVGDYRIEIAGIPAHAGVEPGRGASAVHELARQALAVLDLARADLGTTVNIGTIEGGTRPNVVAERARMTVDVRVTSMAEAARIERAMRERQAADPRVAIDVHGGINRPPMERSPAVLALYELARAAAAEIGETLLEGTTGGASDGNFTAALGVPTLDGLGAVGDGAHARHEHVRLDALPVRSAILAALILRVGRAALGGPARGL